MPKYMFFASSPEMAEQANLILEQAGKKDCEVRLIPVAGDAEAVRLAQDSGAQIIIARGTIAEEIKRKTSLPVVEIVITAQEMGLLITQAKRVINKPQPRIAVVGVSNMFCDMHDFNQIFDIDLKTYFVESADVLPEAVHKAIADQADLIIGGGIVCTNARLLGIPYLLQPVGSDSIQQAFRVASSVAFAADQEKKNALELKTLLDFSFNGIIKISKTGDVVALNHRAETILGITTVEAIGHNVCDLLPSLDERQIVHDLLINGKEFFCTLLHSTGALAINAAPIQLENEIEGAILSCQEIQKLTEMEAEARRDFSKNGTVPYDLEKLSSLVDENSRFLHTVRSNAKLSECTFLSGSHSFERNAIALYMHNIRRPQNSPFQKISGTAYFEHAQVDNIFGTETIKGVVTSASGGTLFIDEIESLCTQAQYRLSRLLSDHILLRDGMEPTTVDFQLIVGTQADLKKLLQSGKFREDLFYSVMLLKLDIPELKGKINEISNFVTYYIHMYCQKYSRSIQVNKAALNMIAVQPWNGGHTELIGFCRKLVLDAPKRIVDETIAQFFLQDVLPESIINTAAESRKQATNAELSRLVELIEKYDGNRKLISGEMHMSVATLWRRLKKYNLI